MYEGKCFTINLKYMSEIIHQFVFTGEGLIGRYDLLRRGIIDNGRAIVIIRNTTAVRCDSVRELIKKDLYDHGILFNDSADYYSLASDVLSGVCTLA